MASLDFLDLRKTYGNGVRALRDINLSAADGELLAVVGPSGCGKSTLLKLVAGLERPDGGDIRIADRSVVSLPPRERNVALMFQHYTLLPHLNVYDNLAFGLRMRRTPRSEIEPRVREIARILGLKSLLTRLPHALSGGQQQRVALGRAILHQPDVFLLDEPLSNLDARMRIQMRLEIARVRRRLGATMLFVTHDQVEAMTLGQRIAVLHHGRIRQVATPLELYRRPADRFVAGFIGTPSMNFLSPLVSPDGGSLELPGTRLWIPERSRGCLEGRRGRRVDLGLRPEHLECLSESAEDPAPCIRGRVETVERLGSESLVYIDTAGGLLCSRSPSEADFRTGENAQLIPDMNHAHFFDADTGEALRGE